MRSKSATRAERLRTRRREDGRRVGARRAASAQAVPVVVSRHGVVSGGIAAPTRTPRRRVTVARDRNTEVVASIPVALSGWRWLSLLIALGSLLGLVVLWYAPFLRVHTVRVAKTQYIPPAKVAVALAVEGRPVVSLDPQVLRSMLLRRFPALSAAQVSVGLSSVVKVKVTERKPVFVWRLGKRTLWLAEDGTAFTPPLSHTPKGLVMPKVQASTLPEGAREIRPGLWRMLRPEQVRQLHILAQSLPKGTTLVFHKRYGLGWRAPQGWQVFVGENITQMDKRLAVYQALSSWFEANGIKPAIVSLQSLQAPYYRMEP